MYGIRWPWMNSMFILIRNVTHVRTKDILPKLRLSVSFIHINICCPRLDLIILQWIFYHFVFFLCLRYIHGMYNDCPHMQKEREIPWAKSLSNNSSMSAPIGITKIEREKKPCFGENEEYGPYFFFIDNTALDIYLANTIFS